MSTEYLKLPVWRWSVYGQIINNPTNKLHWNAFISLLSMSVNNGAIFFLLEIPHGSYMLLNQILIGCLLLSQARNND